MQFPLLQDITSYTHPAFDSHTMILANKEIESGSLAGLTMRANDTTRKPV
jgi:hypothetical protein